MAGIPELLDDGLRDIRWHRETDPDRAARRRVDRGIDPDHRGVEVEGRSAGIAAVDRRVDLDVVVVRSLVDVAPDRRNDAGGHRAAEPERIADRDDPVADLGLIAVAPGDKRQFLARVYLEQSEVGLLVPADHVRLV